MRKFIIYIPEKIHKIVKIMCAKQDMAMTKYIVALIEADLKKRGEI